MRPVSLFDLFKTFFFLGLSTFGGGLAMLPFIKKQVMDKGWITEVDWQQFLAVIQITPGALAVNLSHLIGYKVGGWRGGLISVLGMVLPSLLVISLFAFALQDWINEPSFQSIMQGVYLVVIAFLIKALIDFLRSSYRESLAWVYGCFASFLLVMAWINPTWLIGLALLLGGVEWMVKHRP